jgi:hypothetical protein
LASVAVVQRDEQRPGSEKARDLVGERERREQRRLPRGAADLGEAGERLGKCAESWPVTVRAGLPEGRQPHDHQSRIHGLQRLRREVQPLEHAGAKALYERIGGFDESKERGSPFRVFQVDGD